MSTCAPSADCQRGKVASLSATIDGVSDAYPLHVQQRMPEGQYPWISNVAIQCRRMSIVSYGLAVPPRKTAPADSGFKQNLLYPRRHQRSGRANPDASVYVTRTARWRTTVSGGPTATGAPATLCTTGSARPTCHAARCEHWTPDAIDILLARWRHC